MEAQLHLLKDQGIPPVGIHQQTKVDPPPQEITLPEVWSRVAKPHQQIDEELLEWKKAEYVLKEKLQNTRGGGKRGAQKTPL